MIDRFRVSFESGSAWHCACRDFAVSKACSHTREAAGMRAAQARIVEHVATGRSQLTPNVGADSRDVVTTPGGRAVR
jgi:hypothetical protein